MATLKYLSHNNFVLYQPVEENHENLKKAKWQIANFAIFFFRSELVFHSGRYFWPRQCYFYLFWSSAIPICKLMITLLLIKYLTMYILPMSLGPVHLLEAVNLSMKSSLLWLVLFWNTPQNECTQLDFFLCSISYDIVEQMWDICCWDVKWKLDILIGKRALFLKKISSGSKSTVVLLKQVNSYITCDEVFLHPNHLLPSRLYMKRRLKSQVPRTVQ